MEWPGTGVKAWVGEEGIHVGWGLEDRGQLQPWAGCQSPSGLKRAFAWGTGKHRQRGLVITYRGINQISKYIKDNGRQISYCQRRELQRGKRRKLKLTLWCWTGIDGIGTNCTSVQEIVVYNLPIRKILSPYGFRVNFSKHLMNNNSIQTLPKIEYFPTHCTSPALQQ